MLTKQGLLTEDIRIQVGNRIYHNLDHYSPNCVSTGQSIYGAFNSFRPDTFEYDNSGEPIVAKFREPIVRGTGNGTKRIIIPITRMREEVSELESELLKSDDKSNVAVIGEGRFQLKVNEFAERIRGLIKQRRDFLSMYIDVPRELERCYAGIELTK